MPPYSFKFLTCHNCLIDSDPTLQATIKVDCEYVSENKNDYEILTKHIWCNDTVIPQF